VKSEEKMEEVVIKKDEVAEIKKDDVSAIASVASAFFGFASDFRED
jgi:uncharacterized membrane protein YjfL (UPF0719 family)